MGRNHTLWKIKKKKERNDCYQNTVYVRLNVDNPTVTHTVLSIMENEREESKIEKKKKSTFVNQATN